MSEPVTFNNLPEAVSLLLAKVERLEAMLCSPTGGQDSPQIEWMSIDALRDYLPSKPAKQTVYGWVSRKVIPHHKRGKAVMFKKSEIDTWIEQGKRDPETAGSIDRAADALLRRKKEGRK